jgi:hypothetical protein
MSAHQPSTSQPALAFMTYWCTTWLLANTLTSGHAADALVSWQRVYYDPVPVFDDLGFHAVTYGGGTFAAVGIDVAVSTDGTTWKRFPRPCQTLLLSIAHGAGRFVAVGGAVSLAGGGQELDPSAIVTSKDGLAWTTVLEEHLESDEADPLGWRQFVLTDVAWAGDHFVAVGHGVGTLIMTSADGLTWDRVTSTVQPYCESIAYGQGIYVVVGGRVLTSMDCLNWTSQTLGSVGDYDFLGRVRYGQSVFVLSGINPSRLFTSRDGYNWTLAWEDDAGNSPSGIAFGVHSSVCVGTGADSGPLVLTAARDAQWSRQDVRALVPTQPNASGYLPLTDVAFGDGRYVAVGWSHLILLGIEASGPPVLSCPRLDRMGVVEFDVAANPYTPMRIEASEDLVDWFTVTNVVSQSTSVQVTDATPAFVRARFYRAVSE